jgi:hypothetical protein
MRALPVVAVLALSLLLQACGSIYRPYDNPNEEFKKVSAIELRSIQTRKFNKSFDEVEAGIVTNCKDKNGNGSSSTSCTWPFNGYYFDRNSRKLERLTYRVEYEVTPDKQSPRNSTLVRMRIYFIQSSTGFRSNNEPQVTNPAYYQREFKDLADTLFVSAIELTPVEMQ